MRILEEIVKHNWDFIVCKTDKGYIIKVVFYNSFVDTSKSFFLNKEEANKSFEELKKLSEHIRNNYELYKDREVIPSL